MAKANVYNMAGQQVGEIELSEAVFGIEPNQAVVHEVVKNHLANCRQGTQSALTRAEVSGGGKKPWRQKGTGHARQGSTRAPQWTHGGIVFAPKPRDYSYTLNKKVKRLALKSVLSAKAAEGNVIVVDELNVPEIKTKTMRGFLAGIGAGKSVVITPEVDEIVVKSARNIPGVVTTTAKILSVYDIVNAEKPVITAQCFRVPVSDGHTAAVFVSFDKKPGKEEILKAWAEFRGPAQELDLPSAPKQFLHYFEENDRPQPKLDRNTEHGMAVCIGRLREDTLFDYKFACMSHNTLRGAAGGAVLLAELLAAKGYFD